MFYHRARKSFSINRLLQIVSFFSSEQSLGYPLGVMSYDGHLLTVGNQTLPATLPQYSHSLDLSLSLPTAPTKNKGTGWNVTYAVRTFERWLERRSNQGQRKIETIPPVELDSYLVEFFGSIKNTSGKDYSSESFRILRTNISSHLKEQHYPASITSSSCFARSQNAFMLRKRSLKEKELKGSV